MAKGDTIRLVVRGMDAITVSASQNGRNVEVEDRKIGSMTWLVVKETTRGGTTVREVRAPHTEVLGVDINKKEIA